MADAESAAYLLQLARETLPEELENDGSVDTAALDALPVCDNDYAFHELPNAIFDLSGRKRPPVPVDYIPRDPGSDDDGSDEFDEESESDDEDEGLVKNDDFFRSEKDFDADEWKPAET